MRLKTGAALLIGILIGVASTVRLYGGITASQVERCAKTDRPRI